jgi:hypothetical protein
VGLLEDHRVQAVLVSFATLQTSVVAVVAPQTVSVQVALLEQVAAQTQLAAMLVSQHFMMVVQQLDRVAVQVDMAQLSWVTHQHREIHPAVAVVHQFKHGVTGKQERLGKFNLSGHELNPKIHHSVCEAAFQGERLDNQFQRQSQHQSH